MRNTLAILVVCLGWCAGAVLAQNTAPLHLVQTITMDPSVEGKFDHMAVDVKGGRLFLTAPNYLFVQNGKTQPSARLWPRFPLPGMPEFAVADDAGNIFINSEDTGSMVVLDAANKAKSTWPIKGGEDPSGLAFDTKVHKLFAACSNKVMTVVESQNGKVLQTVPIGEDYDATAFDPGTGTAFASNNDGTLTIVRAGSSGSYNAVQTLTLGDGGKTTGLDLSTHKLYVPQRRLLVHLRHAPAPRSLRDRRLCSLSASKEHATWIIRTTIPSSGDRG
jgi:hypothetical protein